AAAVTLWVLDDALAGFDMEHWWLAPVCALLLGLLAAVVWPLVMRVALPVAVYTFGLGALVLLAVAVVALFSVVPGVRLAGPVEALAVVLGTALATVLVSALLAVDTDEIFFRRAGLRARRRDAGGGSPRPGVLFLQVDGLGLPTLRRAVRDGTMPTLARWLTDGSHRLAGWHTDWSAQTGASQCGILHGDNDDVVGFRWYDKDRRRVVTCSSPGDAAEIERRHSDGHGLLSQDGAGRGNLFTGDAAHVSLTLSAVPLLTRARGGRVRSDRIGAGYYAYFANPVNGVRTAVAALVEVVRELVDASRQRRADVRPRIRRGGLYPLARAGTTVVARDVLVSALIEDMLAGRPVAYADFVGYDEVAHHSGIERADTLHVLRAIDQQIGRLHRAAALAPRPYELVVLSDHGQTQGQAFTDRFGESVEHVVGRLCGVPGEDPADSGPEPVRGPHSADGWQLGATLAEAGSGAGPVARVLTARRTRADRDPSRIPPGRPAPASRAAPQVVVLASGHTALVSFTALDGRVPLERIERDYPDLLPGLVDHPGVGFVLVRGEEDGPMVLGRDGTHRLADGVVTGEDPLGPYGPHAAALVARVDGFAHCADIMVNSRYDPVREDASPFEPHVGSHGGLGGPQNEAFVLHPASWAEPGEPVGAEELHRVLRGWLTDLGHLLPATAETAGGSGAGGARAS
ncbi:phage holin family protein, partial [Pseudonocardia sp. KRD291]|uniref:phage holin family protein n=1 Tax=Pseudonocardia sp. KRD291 TaxID=2792007 RepID=UPI001C49CBC5